MNDRRLLFKIYSTLVNLGEACCKDDLDWLPADCWLFNLFWVDTLLFLDFDSSMCGFNLTCLSFGDFLEKVTMN